MLLAPRLSCHWILLSSAIEFFCLASITRATRNPKSPVIKVTRYSFSGSIPPYVAINKDLEKLPSQLTLYQIKVKICYEQSCNDIGVVIATKLRYYLFCLQQYFLALGTVLRKSLTGAFSCNSGLDVREV